MKNYLSILLVQAIASLKVLVAWVQAWFGSGHPPQNNRQIVLFSKALELDNPSDGRVISFWEKSVFFLCSQWQNSRDRILLRSNYTRMIQKSSIVSLFAFILLVLISQHHLSAQAVQWSQYVGHKDQANPSASSRAFSSRVVKAADGSIYELGNTRKPLAQPLFTTSDVKYLGNIYGDGIGMQLSKYNNDGKLLWVT